MKRTIIIIVAVIVIVIGLVWAVTRKQDTPVLPDDRLTFGLVQENMKNGAKLYDVRTAEEFAAGHFAGAINFPVETLQSGTLPDVAKDTTIYVYCRSGNRSGQAATILKNAGFTQVTDLGGLSDVEAIGGKLETN
jgi:phage shock protein E